MKIVNIIGGLGNQMFQYAFAMALQTQNPDESVYIDISHFRGYPLHSGFELQRIFGELLPVARWNQQMQVSYYIPHYVLSRICRRILPRRKHEYIEIHPYCYDANVFNIRDDCYFEGYWQTPKYFERYRTTIEDIFRFPLFVDSANLATAAQMDTGNSVALHIRRGDYTGSVNYAGICTLYYYRKAIKVVMEKIHTPEFFIFSDDMAWCEKNILPMVQEYEVSLVNFNTRENSFRDMHLMSLARCCIMANSSFSWWAAWLNKRPDKLVIAPYRWVNGTDSMDIYPAGWKLIQPQR